MNSTALLQTTDANPPDSLAAQIEFCFVLDGIDRRIGQWARNYIRSGKTIRDTKRRLAYISAVAQES